MNIPDLEPGVYLNYKDIEKFHKKKGVTTGDFHGVKGFESKNEDYDLLKTVKKAQDHVKRRKLEKQKALKDE